MFYNISKFQEEFVDLCVFGDGIVFPLLGELRPVKPENLYTWFDVEEQEGIPEEIKHLATVVFKKM